MKNDERAWISVDTAFVPLTEGNPIDIIVTLKNTGKTPASEIHAEAVVETLKRSESASLEYPSSTNNLQDVKVNAGLLMPNVKTEFHARQVTTEHKLDDPVPL